MSFPLPDQDIPAGLDTYEWLAGDVLGRRFTLANGTVDIAELDACAATLNIESLVSVYRG